MVSEAEDLSVTSPLLPFFFFDLDSLLVCKLVCELLCVLLCVLFLFFCRPPECERCSLEQPFTSLSTSSSDVRCLWESGMEHLCFSKDGDSRGGVDEGGGGCGGDDGGGGSSECDGGGGECGG